MSCPRVIWVFVGLLLLPHEVVALSINEVVPNASVEWVELYNASDSAEYLKQYFIDDDQSFTSDSGSGAKKSLTDLTVTNSTYPYFDVSSFFNNAGDWVVLFDPKGAIIDQYQYDEDPGSGVSLGRSPDGTGTFAILRSATKGSQNDEILMPTATATPTSMPTSSPAPTNTPVNTPKPTQTTTPTATITPSKIPTPIRKPTIRREPTESTESVSSDILGTQEIATEEAKVNESRPLVFSLLFIGTGLGLLAAALALQKTNVWKTQICQKKEHG